DLLVHPPAKGHIGPYAGADLADEPAPNQQLVARDFGVRRVVAERWKEELRSSGDRHREQRLRECCQRRRRSFARGKPGFPRVRRSHSIGIRLASAIASAAGLAIFKRFGRCIPSAIHSSIAWKSSSTRMSDETFFSTRPW